MFKTLKEMVVVFHVVVPVISDQDKGHKIMHFVYNSNKPEIISGHRQCEQPHMQPG